MATLSSSSVTVNEEQNHNSNIINKSSMDTDNDSKQFIHNLIHNVRLHTIRHIAQSPLPPIVSLPSLSSSFSSSSSTLPSDALGSTSVDEKFIPMDDTEFIRNEIYNNPEAVKHHYIRIGKNLDFRTRATSSSSSRITHRPDDDHEEIGTTKVHSTEEIPHEYRLSNTLHLLLQSSRKLRQESVQTFALLQN